MMRKYLKPEVRFLETQFAERIAANCWGTSSSTSDSVTITYSKGSVSGSATVNEGSTVPWVDCIGNNPLVPLEVRQKMVDILRLSPENSWVGLSYIGPSQFNSNSLEAPVLLDYAFGFSGSSSGS